MRKINVHPNSLAIVSGGVPDCRIHDWKLATLTGGTFKTPNRPASKSITDPLGSGERLLLRCHVPGLRRLACHLAGIRFRSHLR